jgi:hypothetical protein
MLICPLCCEKYVFVQSLCDDCKKVKHAMSLYGSEKNKCVIYDKDEEKYEKKGGKWLLKEHVKEN